MRFRGKGEYFKAGENSCFLEKTPFKSKTKRR